MSRDASSPERVPIVVLAGSDGRPGPVPEGAEGLHFVVAYKGAELRVKGRPLVAELVSRIRASGVFGEVFVAGPRRVFGSLVDASIVDTDADVGTNIGTSIRAVRERCGRDTRVAFIACDILPIAAELRDLGGQLLAAGPDGADPPALALSMVVPPEELGASGWKPLYRIRLEADRPPQLLLPGHLGVARPARLRSGLLCRILQLGYQKRNVDQDERRRWILVHLLGALIWRDLLNIARLHPPSLAWSVLRGGSCAFRAWRRGELTVDGLCRGAAQVMVRRRWRRRQGAGAVRVVCTPFVSFARDIDTEEEAHEILRDVDPG